MMKSNNKKFHGLLLDEDGCHYEYNGRLKTNDSTLILSRSKLGNWAFWAKEQEVGRLEFDGNGVKIKIINKPQQYLDYLEFWELYNMMHTMFFLKNKKPCERINKDTFTSKRKKNETRA
jgi:hypothetical protein